MFLDLSELSGKHLQLLKEIIPRTSRVAVLGDLDINAPQLRELALVARSLALETQAVEFKNATNLDGAFDAAKAGVQTMITSASTSYDCVTPGSLSRTGSLQ